MCGGDGHTESLQLTYDPTRLSYNDLLQVGTGFSHVCMHLCKACMAGRFSMAAHPSAAVVSLTALRMLGPGCSLLLNYVAAALCPAEIF